MTSHNAMQGLEPTLYEASVPGRCGLSLPRLDVPEAALPETWLRSDLGLPELSELDVIRHYQHLAQRNFGVDSGFYPLGSCTMKYNPRICEEVARLDGFALAHPLAPEGQVQGNLALMWRLQRWLAEIGGFAQVYVIVVGGQAYPLDIFPGYEVLEGFHEGVINPYTPSIWELMLGLGGVALALFAAGLGAKVLRVLPTNLSDANIAAKG